MEPVDKKAFGQRVAARRTKLFPSQGALATVVGMEQQGIDSIEKGGVERPRLLREIARALRTSEEWLLWRRGPEDIEESAAQPDFLRVPLLDWVSAGRLTEPRSQIPVEDVPLLAFADLGRGDFFALRVDGDSMDRVSPGGSVIVVNRADQQLVAGKCYVFLIKGETTFKAWQPARAGQPPYLEPLTTNTTGNKPMFFKGKSPLVVGRVCRTILDL